jgi:hypothetical protein
MSASTFRSPKAAGPLAAIGGTNVRFSRKQSGADRPQFAECAMITAEKCRIHATECKVLALSIDISTQRSLEQSIMALNWEALADQIDHDNSQATEARLVALFAGAFRPLVA